MADRTPSAGRAAAATSDDLTDQTPRVALNTTSAINDDSRMNAVRDAETAKEKKALVYLTYQGRKGRLFPGEDDEDDDDADAGVHLVPDEHIDVIVPNKANKRRAAAYLDAGAPGGRLSDTQLNDLRAGGISHETLQVSGHGYHFVAGQSTPVRPEHADWLRAHPTYRFATTAAPD